MPERGGEGEGEREGQRQTEYLELGAGEPVTQGRPCSSHANNNNAIKFYSTGRAFFA